MPDGFKLYFTNILLMVYTIVMAANWKTPNVPLEGVSCYMDGEILQTDNLGLTYFYRDTRGPFYYEIITPSDYHFVHGEMPFDSDIPSSGYFTIPESWLETDTYTLFFQFEEGEVTYGKELLGKAGSLLATSGLVGIIFDSASKKR